MNIGDIVRIPKTPYGQGTVIWVNPQTRRLTIQTATGPVTATFDQVVVVKRNQPSAK